MSMEFSRQEYWSGLLCPSPGTYLVEDYFYMDWGSGAGFWVIKWIAFIVHVISNLMLLLI